MRCPGWYCGRISLPNGDLSECGPCPRGFRRNDTTFICEPCTDNPTFYDWLYLGFMVMLVLILHWFFIDMVSMRRSKDVILLHTTAFVEILLSCIIALLLSHPIGSFMVHSCQVRSMSDWYTLLHNPTPKYENYSLYPRSSLSIIYGGLSLLWPVTDINASHKAMGVQKVSSAPEQDVDLCGYVFHSDSNYSFPYLVVILSLISCAAHFAIKMDQSIMSLIVTTVVEPRNVVILIGHWCLHAYGIISITQLTDPLLHSLLIILVPLPALFYVFTAKFTDPNKCHF
ncbi:hypothetical protein NQ318_001010 [Aromia moschata]|uniref:JNK1/MAPK8-associated membrane protein n=1 Tax=Aromia moschata TaxID=1265417 RepID=A0AAV8ZGC3_9CUCU|nr:hypothetical protein NQ318_001010 [Aromia moschata]